MSLTSYSVACFAASVFLSSSIFLSSFCSTPANYQSITSTIFSYLQLLLTAPSSTLHEAYHEVHQTRTLDFTYLEKASSPSRYASALAAKMAGPWPRNEIVSAGYLVEKEFDEDVFRQLVRESLRAEDVRLLVGAWEVPKSGGGKWDRKEEIYGTEYKLVKFDEAFMDQVSRSDSSCINLIILLLPWLISQAVLIPPSPHPLRLDPRERLDAIPTRFSAGAQS